MAEDTEEFFDFLGWVSVHGNAVIAEEAAVNAAIEHRGPFASYRFPPKPALPPNALFSHWFDFVIPRYESKRFPSGLKKVAILFNSAGATVKRVDVWDGSTRLATFDANWSGDRSGEWRDAEDPLANTIRFDDIPAVSRGLCVTVLVESQGAGTIQFVSAQVQFKL
jgi:hypothetical protein